MFYVSVGLFNNVLKAYSGAKINIMEINDVIIIGGGAAGLMCAIQAAQRGRSVVILERNDRIGKKILISKHRRLFLLSVQSEWIGR